METKVVRHRDGTNCVIKCVCVRTCVWQRSTAVMHKYKKKVKNSSPFQFLLLFLFPNKMKSFHTYTLYCCTLHICCECGRLSILRAGCVFVLCCGGIQSLHIRSLLASTSDTMAGVSNFARPAGCAAVWTHPPVYSDLKHTFVSLFQQFF